jgi:hypothetical protein
MGKEKRSGIYGENSRPGCFAGLPARCRCKRKRAPRTSPSEQIIVIDIVIAHRNPPLSAPDSIHPRTNSTLRSGTSTLLFLPPSAFRLPPKPARCHTDSQIYPGFTDIRHLGADHAIMNPIRLLPFAVLFASVAPLSAAPPPQEIVDAVTKAIRAHCPDAVITVGKDGLTASHNTMTFTLHGRSMTGEISAKTHTEEGPNFKGFLLRLTLEDGSYQGQAAVPQTLQDPYWRTFLDAIPVPGANRHYWLSFAEGTRLDPELRKAIFAALPKAAAAADK